MWGDYGGHVLLLAANPLHPGAVYHITPRGDRRELVYGDDEDGGRTKEDLSPARTQCRCAFYLWHHAARASRACTETALRFVFTALSQELFGLRINVCPASGG
jgi:hypothetical protein